jgi:hypothetical protein
MTRRPRATSALDSALDGKPQILSGARYIRWLVRTCATVLVLLFSWLKLSGVDFHPLAADITAGLLFQVTMALYYLLWVAGLTSDTDEQEAIYVAAPSKRHTYIGGATTAFFITLVFILLCLVKTPTQFAFALLFFHLINIAAWHYLTKRVMKAEFRKSERIYREADDFSRLEKLRLVYDWYLAGGWQWGRFAAGGVVVIAAALVAGYFAHSGQSSIRVYGQVVSMELSIALLLLLYAVVMEAWIWRNRLVMSAQLDLIDELREKYQFVPET